MSDADTKVVECDGCDEVKTVPVILIDDTPFDGICEDCVRSYGIQVGDTVRLHQPGHNAESEPHFIGLRDDGIQVRYSDGHTARVGRFEFEKIR